MANWAEWSKLGISVRRQSGEEKTFCPRCRDQRRHRSDKSLSVNHDKGVYHCHHCDWRGGIGDKSSWTLRQPKVYVKPDYKPLGSAMPHREKLLSWFAARAIPAEIVDEFGIELRRHYIPATQAEEWAMVFPYLRHGEVVNVKYRTREKHFAMEKDAELLFYNFDKASECEGDTLFVVEGEPDVLACAVAGYRNVVSVPAGAKTNLDLLADCEGWLAGFERIVFAGDSDTAGQQLAEELIRRVGVERCWRVEWPFGCKDANDVLLEQGAEVLASCLLAAKPVPIDTALHIDDIRADVTLLYETGRSRGVSTGWNVVDKFYRVRPGEWTVVTGAPGSGKSSWVAALSVHLARLHGWRFVVYPPENLPAQEYASSLLEIWAGEPFDDGPTPRMTERTRDKGLTWLQEHFVILDPGEDQQTLEGIFDVTQAFIRRWGANGLIIDPWNEVDHQVPQGMTTTDYTGKQLRKLGRFCRHNGVHTWIVAHPIKLVKDKDGKYPVPTLYDIEDSRHWHNKCDFGISMWRDKSDDRAPIQIHTQKVRRRWMGQLGMAELYYNKVCGQYFDRGWSDAAAA